MTAMDYEEDIKSDTLVDTARLALDAFKAQRTGAMQTQEEVCWLLDHFPAMTLTATAKTLGVTTSLVHRYAEKRNKQRASAAVSCAASVDGC